MTRLSLTSQTVVLVVVGILATVSNAEPSDVHWTAESDKVYLQEVGEQIPTDSPITAVAVHAGVLYAVENGALKSLQGSALDSVADAPSGITRMVSLDGAIWATGSDGAYRFVDDSWTKVSDHSMVDFCVHDGKVHAADRDDVYQFDGRTLASIKPATGWLSNDTTMLMADGTQVLANPVRIGTIQRIASYSGTLYLLRNQGLGLLNHHVFVPEPFDWGAMPSAVQRDVLSQGSRLYTATDRGVSVLRGMALTTLQGEDGLPYEDTTCLASGFDHDIWIGTTSGAVRKVGDEFHYFGAYQWLPGERVNAIAVDGKDVYIATDAGLGIIRYEPYTLRKKAAFFERQLDEWGVKRLGFVHKLFNYSGEWLREISDNDGGHTAHYLAAMSYKYAATGDEDARAEAVESFKAMIWLDDVTPKVGFIARSIWSVDADKGPRGEHGSGGLPAKWYETEDGKWIWKGDTSSDEVNSHYYAVSLFRDLVANESEKKRAERHLANISDHIIENGWVLRDMDGQPTRWGQWSPEYLLTPYGFEAIGLNGMEAQMYMVTSYAQTGDDKYKKGLDQLLKWNYHKYTVRQKLTFPPESVVPWDDELAFRAYYPLITYNENPMLQSIYLRSLERHWEVMRMQKLAFYNFLYGHLTGNDCEVAEATQALREWSLDSVGHSYRNSHRSDLQPEDGYVPYMGITKAMSPRNLVSSWGARTALKYDDNGGGNVVTPPVGWLEDYWMGRYYGMIEAPAATDPALLSVGPKSDQAPKAVAYDGPSRPDKPF